MADVKISALPTASIVNDADIAVINQGGTTKTASKALIVAGLATTNQISGLATTAQLSAFQNSAQVQSLASAQIAAITPASIGAFATSAIIGIGNGGTGATDAPSALAALGGITSAQVPAFDSAQLSAYVLKAGSTMDGRLIMAATTAQAKANIGGAIGAASPSSIAVGDVWVSNQSKLTFSPSTGVNVGVAGLSQINTFNQTQLIGVGGTVNALTVSNNGTGRAATFTAASSSAAVSILQTGAGEAFRVEDETSPDTTPFVISASGRVGIGVTPDAVTALSIDGGGIKFADGSIATTALAGGGLNSAQIQALTTAQLSAISIDAGEGLSGGGNISASRTLQLAALTTEAISLGSSSEVPVITVDTFGRVASTGVASITPDSIGAFAGRKWENNRTYNIGDIVSVDDTGYPLGQLYISETDGNISKDPRTLDDWAYVKADAKSIVSAEIIGNPTGQQTLTFNSSNGTFVFNTIDAAWTGALADNAVASGDLSGNYPSPTVAKIQGNAVSEAAPSNGQVLQWNGTAWVPGEIPSGGSGGGGQVFFFNYNTAAEAPTTGLPTTPTTVKELGRVSDTTGTSYTSGNLSTTGYDLVVHFVTDVLDPNITSIPAGLFDFNFWASSTGTTTNQTIVQLKVFKYDGTTATLLSTSDDISIYDPTVTAQYIASVVIPQTTVSTSDRLYIQFLGKATQNNKTVTFNFGATQPSHVHTTVPSVGGSGLVKVVDGVFQSPASLLVNADVATNAAIALSKVAMSQVSVLSGDGLTGGGDLSTSRTLALTTTGVSALSYGSSTQVAALTVDAYGRLTAASNIPIPVAPSTAYAVFSTVGASSWSKPAGAKRVRVQLWGGGGGGGGGGRGAAGTLVAGGGGGGSGACMNFEFDAFLLGATETVTIGAGGNAGASASTDSSTGGTGGSGGLSSFGAWVTCYGGGGGVGGSQGAGATGNAGGGGFRGNQGASASTSGAAGVTGVPSTTTSSSMAGNGGGGSGAGLPTTHASANGGGGGRFTPLNLTGGSAGTAPGGAGGAGNSGTTNASTGGIVGASGGGGGASNAGGIGGSGGAGGFGAGGGGGGAAPNGSASGAGGAGGAGYAIITTFFA
jgi:hypothetical protein